MKGSGSCCDCMGESTGFFHKLGLMWLLLLLIFMGKGCGVFFPYITLHLISVLSHCLSLAMLGLLLAVFCWAIIATEGGIAFHLGHCNQF